MTSNIKTVFACDWPCFVASYVCSCNSLLQKRSKPDTTWLNKGCNVWCFACGICPLCFLTLVCFVKQCLVKCCFVRFPSDLSNVICHCAWTLETTHHCNIQQEFCSIITTIVFFMLMTSWPHKGQHKQFWEMQKVEVTSVENMSVRADH